MKLFILLWLNIILAFFILFKPFHDTLKKTAYKVFLPIHFQGSFALLFLCSFQALNMQPEYDKKLRSFRIWRARANLSVQKYPFCEHLLFFRSGSLMRIYERDCSLLSLKLNRNYQWKENLLKGWLVGLICSFPQMELSPSKFNVACWPEPHSANKALVTVQQ